VLVGIARSDNTRAAQANERLAQLNCCGLLAPSQQANMLTPNANIICGCPFIGVGSEWHYCKSSTFARYALLFGLRR